MKYCINYTPGSDFRYLNEIDEIIIKYNRKDTTLPAFLEEHSSQTVIIKADADIFSDTDDFNRITALYNKYPNIMLYFQYNTEIAAKVADAEIPFYFDKIVDSWDEFHEFLKWKPVYIHVTRSLCFSIDKVAEIAHKSEVRVRCFPNLAQASFDTLNPMLNFFIRPEDVPIYEPYIDVLELAGTDPQLSAYYEIYQKQKWNGNLDEIIIGLSYSLDAPVNNRNILPLFGKMRIKCGKACLQGGRCQICPRSASLGQILDRKNLTFH